MESTQCPAPERAQPAGDTLPVSEIAELLDLLTEENLPFLMKRQVS
jgi:hypothetical protein